jgi:hypothetical protein
MAPAPSETMKAAVSASSAGGRGCRDEVGARVEGDRARERVGAQLDQGDAVGRGTRADGVEEDVDTTRALDHGFEVRPVQSGTKLVSLPVMTATGQVDARRTWNPTR